MISLPKLKVSTHAPAAAQPVLIDPDFDVVASFDQRCSELKRTNRLGICIGSFLFLVSIPGFVVSMEAWVKCSRSESSYQNDINNPIDINSSSQSDLGSVSNPTASAGFHCEILSLLTYTVAFTFLFSLIYLASVYKKWHSLRVVCNWHQENAATCVGWRLRDYEWKSFVQYRFGYSSGWSKWWIIRYQQKKLYRELMNKSSGEVIVSFHSIFCEGMTMRCKRGNDAPPVLERASVMRYQDQLMLRLVYSTDNILFKAYDIFLPSSVSASQAEALAASLTVRPQFANCKPSSVSTAPFPSLPRPQPANQLECLAIYPTVYPLYKAGSLAMYKSARVPEIDSSSAAAIEAESTALIDVTSQREPMSKAYVEVTTNGASSQDLLSVKSPLSSISNVPSSPPLIDCDFDVCATIAQKTTKRKWFGFKVMALSPLVLAFSIVLFNLPILLFGNLALFTAIALFIVPILARKYDLKRAEKVINNSELCVGWTLAGTDCEAYHRFTGSFKQSQDEEEHKTENLQGAQQPALRLEELVRICIEGSSPIDVLLYPDLEESDGGNGNSECGIERVEVMQWNSYLLLRISYLHPTAEFNGRTTQGTPHIFASIKFLPSYATVMQARALASYYTRQAEPQTTATMRYFTRQLTDELTVLAEYSNESYTDTCRVHPIVLPNSLCYVRYM